MNHSLLEQFDWDEDREDHIARHHVKIDEVLEIFANPHWFGPWEDDKRRFYGRTNAGRYLIVIVGRRRWSKRIWLVTAREMDTSERRLYQRRMG